MVNKSEEFVYEVCRKSFLSLWSYANPLQKKGKELCDILIVCEPDIIIFSVKDIVLTQSGDAEVDWKRWQRRAVEGSCSQIYGAEKWVRETSHVIKHDGSQGVAIRKDINWRVHRVAVALGNKGQSPFQFGDFGKGFVHVLDEISFALILRELDTITDFVDYLVKKEEMFIHEAKLLFGGAEEDLLAFYLINQRMFPSNPDTLMLEPDLWASLQNRPEYQAKKVADRESYIWDALIEALCKESPRDYMESGPLLTDADHAVRAMARENRFARRILGRAYRDFLETAQRDSVAARVAQGPSGVGYVFMARSADTDREVRVKELALRCWVVRSLLENCNTVVGISDNGKISGLGYSTSMVYLHKEEWMAEDQKIAEGIQRDLGYFTSPRHRNVRTDEYPNSE